jgi:ABC-2 type transport system ATP-binding protein
VSLAGAPKPPATRPRPRNGVENFPYIPKLKSAPPCGILGELCGRFTRLRSVASFRAMIEVEGLTKLYGEFTAVSELSFGVRPGEVMGLVGPNGAGKTTTLRCLAGIIPPTRGAIRVCGHDLAREAIAAKRQLGFFTDEPRLFDYLTVWQHLNFVARIYGVADFEPLGRTLLEELEIADKRDNLPGELSRGMKQKLAIACGLLHSPKVIYFDEPLTGLDPMGIRKMKDSILKRARDGAAIILSSHLLHLVEEICSHLLILKNGRKIAAGTLAEIMQQFAGQTGDASLEEIFFRATIEPPKLESGQVGK